MAHCCRGVFVGRRVWASRNSEVVGRVAPLYFAGSLSRPRRYSVQRWIGAGSGGGASGGRDLLERGGFLQRGSCEQASQIGVDLGKSIVEDAEDLGRHEGEPEHDVCGRKVIADHVGLVS